MEVSVDSTDDLRSRFGGYEPGSPQRFALLHDVLASKEADSLVGQLLSEHAIGIQMADPGAVAIAHANLEIITEALELHANELPDWAYQACADLRDQSADAALRDLVPIALHVIDALDVLEQECASVTASRPRLTGLPHVATFQQHVSTLQTQARAVRQTLLSAVEGLTHPRQLLVALHQLTDTLHLAAMNAMEALARASAAPEAIDNARRVGMSTVAVLNPLTDRGTELSANASQCRQLLLDRIHRVHIGKDNTSHATAEGESITLETLPIELLAHVIHTLPHDQQAEAMHRLSLANQNLYATTWRLRHPERTPLPIRSQKDLDRAAADPTIPRIVIDTDTGTAGSLTFRSNNNAELYIHGHGQLWMRGSGENNITAAPTAIVVVYSGTVHALGSSDVHAHESSTVHARGTSDVLALDDSTVHAYAGSTVHATETSTVHARETSTVKARDSSTVHAADNCTVDAWNSSTVHAADNCTVQAWKTSTVHAKDNCTVHGWERSTVHAADNCTVELHKKYASAIMQAGTTLHLRAESKFTALGPITVTFPDGRIEKHFTGDGPYGGCS